MIDRAKRWGINWKSSLVSFAELMISIAPNFDQQADIKRVLESDKEQANQRIKSITEYVPDFAWSQAEANSDDLPFFFNRIPQCTVNRTNSQCNPAGFMG